MASSKPSPDRAMMEGLESPLCVRLKIEVIAPGPEGLNKRLMRVFELGGTVMGGEVVENAGWENERLLMVKVPSPWFSIVKSFCIDEPMSFFPKAIEV